LVLALSNDEAETENQADFFPLHDSACDARGCSEIFEDRRSIRVIKSRRRFQYEAFSLNLGCVDLKKRTS